MAKVMYNGITFDSELEVEYYKEISNDPKVKKFIYHPRQIENLVGKRNYTPDFIVWKDLGNGESLIEIVECKGYNPYSKMIDDQIHNVMLSKNDKWLRQYAANNFVLYALPIFTDPNIQVIYRKIKYLKAYGFVDWDFKNPNTIANKRKEKITDLTEEVKELKEFKKNMLRYLTYHKKSVENQKLTKSQKEWYYNYVNEINKLLEENK